jgi:uracil-DNA glycosylase
MKYGKEFWVNELGKDWTRELKDTLRTPYAAKLMEFVSVEYAMNNVIPLKEDIFRAFKLCEWKDVKVVILGLEPGFRCLPSGLAYGEKHIMEFHSAELCKIYDHVERVYYEGGFYLDFDFSLDHWAEQGVLLLNKSLTVRKGESRSHLKPWGKFASATLNAVNDNTTGTIFILWGKEAQQLKSHINKNNYVLTFDEPGDYVNTGKDWHCPNFKETDKIMYDLYGETIKW